jgi:hypothetical protein
MKTVYYNAVLEVKLHSTSTAKSTFPRTILTIIVTTEGRLS